MEAKHSVAQDDPEYEMRESLRIGNAVRQEQLFEALCDKFEIDELWNYHLDDNGILRRNGR